MFINIIENMTENIIDLFYEKLDLSNILETPNFIKFQKEINDIINDFNKNYIFIPSEILDKVNEEDKIKILFIINKYLIYYIFLMIGMYYKDSSKLYIKNLIDFFNNQINYDFSMENFFNSSNIAIIREYYLLIKDIHNIIILPKDKQNKIKDNIKYKHIFNYLEELGPDLIDTSFKLENLNHDKHMQFHNIIKTTIFFKMYEQDKTYINNILTKKEISDSKTITIKIVIPLTKTIDMNSINFVLDSFEQNTHYNNVIYDIINKDNTKYNEKYMIDEKINTLVNNKIIVPIVEDFMLLHKEKEMYKTSNTQDDTKLKHLITKINEAKQLNSSKIFFDKNLKALIINSVENNLIYKKIKLLEGYEYYNDDNFHDLQFILHHSYINHNELHKLGFSLFIEKPTLVVRDTSFNGKGMSKLQTRTNKMNEIINIVGFLIPTNMTHISHLTLNKLTNAKKLGDNNIHQAISFLNSKLFDNIKNTNSLFWHFNTTDMIDNTEFSNIDINNQVAIIKYTIAKLYDVIEQNLLDKIDNILKKNTFDIYDFSFIINYMSTKYFNINTTSKDFNLIKMNFYRKYLQNFKDKEDTKLFILYGIDGDIINLPQIKNKKDKIKFHQFKIDYHQKKQIELPEYLQDNKCHHHLIYETIMKHRNYKSSQFTRELEDFINHFIILDLSNNHICKSCGTQVNISNFVSSGFNSSDSQTGEMKFYNIKSNIALNDMFDYKHLPNAIKKLDDFIDNFTVNTNMIYYFGKSEGIKSRRTYIIRTFIDLMKLHTKILHKINAKRPKLYEDTTTNVKISDIFAFDLEDDNFIQVRNDKDKFKAQKLNNIYIYISFLLLLDLIDNHIMQIYYKKRANIIKFMKIKDYLTQDLKIYINKNKKTNYLSNFPVLAYYIYIVSSVLSRNLWKMKNEPETNSKKEREKLIINKQKFIFHTFVDIINNIIIVKSDKFVYTNIQNKYFKMVNQYFNNKCLFDKIKNYYEEIYFSTEEKQKDKNKYTIDIKDIPEEHDNNKFFKTNNIHRVPPNTTNIIKTNLVLDENFNTNLIKYIHKEIIDYTNKHKLKLFFDTKKQEQDFLNSIENKSEKELIEFDTQVRTVSNTKIIPKHEYFDFDPSSLIKKFDNNLNIDTLINTLQENISSKNIKHDKYIINTLYNGTVLKKPFTIYELKKNIDNKYINTVTLSYLDKKNNTTVYYDYYSGIMIGYKKQNENFTKINKQHTFLLRELSISNKLIYMGYQSKYIYTKELIKQKQKDLDIDSKKALEIIINDINRQRFNNIKICIDFIKKSLSRIIYDRNIEKEDFLYKYISLKRMKLKNKEGKSPVFHNWNNISKSLFYSYTTIDMKYKKYIDVLNIMEFDTKSKILLFYLINELLKLMNYNHNRIDIISQLVIDLIKYSFYKFNLDEQSKNIDIMKFKITVSSKLNIDVEKKVELIDYEDIEIENQEQEYDNEKNQALDTENSYMENENTDDNEGEFFSEY